MTFHFVRPVQNVIREVTWRQTCDPSTSDFAVGKQLFWVSHSLFRGYAST